MRIQTSLAWNADSRYAQRNHPERSEVFLTLRSLPAPNAGSFSLNGVIISWLREEPGPNGR